MDFVLLITTQHISQFSFHLTNHLSSLYFISFSEKVLWDTVLKALLVHQASHFIVEGSQAWFPLCKSILTVDSTPMALPS